MWFRQDLRLTDNPAFTEAVRSGRVLPIYILDDDNAGEQAIGAAGRVWLHHSLSKLNDSLSDGLRVYRGAADEILPKIISHHKIDQVHWNRCYEPWQTERDIRIKADLQAGGTKVISENGSLLWEPWDVLKADGTPYRVFTPFYRRGCLAAAPPRAPLPEPENWTVLNGDDSEALSLDELNLLPEIDWGEAMVSHWSIGSHAARERLQEFLDNGLDDYKQGRNFPAQSNVSRLSPHLHWGEISPHQIWHAVSAREQTSDVEHFQSELGWREFAHSLLYHFPDLPTVNLQRSFDAFPWRANPDRLRRWQTGMTGIPIVDAGMRELWATGYMHNRVRMIVGSFLVKNLGQHWREGAAWFWDCLVDADLANNAAGWQWIAGCGADAAPFFRIFNPVTQGQKFDPDGTYTRHYVPELTAMPDEFLFNPWQAPPLVLHAAGVSLGDTYPEPIVDLKQSREEALSAYRQIKSQN